MRQADALHLPDLHRLIEHGIELVDLCRGDLRAHPPQLLYAHAIAHDGLHLLAQRRLDLVHRLAGSGRRFQREQGRPARGVAIGCAGRSRDLALAHQHPVQPCGIVAIQHASQHRQCIRPPVVFDIAQGRRVIRHDQVRQLGRRLDPHALDPALRWLDIGLALRQAARRDLAVVALRQGKHLRRLDIAGDD